MGTEQGEVQAAFNDHACVVDSARCFGNPVDSLAAAAVSVGAGETGGSGLRLGAFRGMSEVRVSHPYYASVYTSSYNAEPSLMLTSRPIHPPPLNANSSP